MFTIKQLTIHDLAFVIRIHLNKLNRCVFPMCARYVCCRQFQEVIKCFLPRQRKICISRFDAVDRLIIKEVF